MASLAKRRTPDEIPYGKSLMYIRKRIDPKTEPQGTPDVTCTVSEASPSSTTRCEWFERKADIQFRAFPRTP